MTLRAHLPAVRAAIALFAVILGTAGCGGGAGGKKVIVLGIDGMDHGMLEAFIAVVLEHTHVRSNQNRW